MTLIELDWVTDLEVLTDRANSFWADNRTFLCSMPNVTTLAELDWAAELEILADRADSFSANEITFLRDT